MWGECLPDDVLRRSCENFPNINDVLFSAPWEWNVSVHAEHAACVLWYDSLKCFSTPHAWTTYVCGQWTNRLIQIHPRNCWKATKRGRSIKKFRKKRIVTVPCWQVLKECFIWFILYSEVIVLELSSYIFRNTADVSRWKTLNQSHLQRRRRCRAHSERRRDEQVAFGLLERTAFTCMAWLSFQRVSYVKRVRWAWVFHGTTAPDISYIVFNIVEILVYKVQWHLIFSRPPPPPPSCPSPHCVPRLPSLASSTRSNSGALLLKYAEDFSLFLSQSLSLTLSGCYLFSLPN